MSVGRLEVEVEVADVVVRHAGTVIAAGELPGSDRAYRIGFGSVRPVLKRCWNLKVEGRDNVPDEGAAILAPNHLAFCDSVFLPAVLDRRLWYIGKGEYMDDWKTKHLFPAFGMIPVDRSGSGAGDAALDTAAGVLETGHLFAIYPEGTRSRSGNLHKGRTGVARLAKRCDVPVIPVGMRGTPEVQPPGSVIMRPFKDVEIRLGAPMRIEEHGSLSDPRTLRAFTDALMFEISQLSGQTYVDEYA